MIRGYCFTNLDEYQREEWPQTFAAIPHIGDRREAKSKRSLRVIAVTHYVANVVTGLSACPIEEPRIRVELHR